MFRTVLGPLVFLLLLSIGAFGQSASVPQTINYQGRLTDANGIEVKEPRKLEFRIYDTSGPGGNLKWGPQTFNAVEFSQTGEFNVILGPTDNPTDNRSLVDAVSDSPRYISITVYNASGASPSEILPRQALLSAPYALQSENAFNADNAKHADDASNGVPVGTILSYFGKAANPPEGWLFCDGQAIPVDDKYTKLRNYLKSLPNLPLEIVDTNVVPPNDCKTPDLRGVFLRGLNNFGTQVGARTDSYRDNQNAPLSSVDGPERPLGSMQSDDFESHNHAVREGTTASSDGSNFDSGPDFSRDVENGTRNKGGAETRPKNMAISFIIKY